MEEKSLALQILSCATEVPRVPGRTGRRPTRSGDMAAKLPAPDVILPEQFFEGARRSSRTSGEKALMLAVLEDAIRCFQGHLRTPRSKPRLLSRRAEAWIRAVDDEWPFSFNNICETLGVDPSALRAALVAWKTERLADRSTGENPSAPAAEKVYRLHLRTKGTSGPGSRRRMRGRGAPR